MVKRTLYSPVAPKEVARMGSQPGNAWPSPVIIPSFKDHKQTFIILHGKGDQASNFAGGFLESSARDYGVIWELFPYAKFIFPQAQKGAMARENGRKMIQWFDNWGYDESGKDKEDLKIEGLRETTLMVHDLLRKEIELVGAKNVVLGGLSQGCAASHVAILTWPGSPLAACLMMCGHLPFREPIERVASATDPDSDKSSGFEAHSWLRKKLDLPASAAENTKDVPFLKTPIFIGHGDQDQVVPTPLGREAAQCMKALGAQSVYHEYEDLGHWYNDDMLHDFIEFLVGHNSWDITDESKV